MDMALVISIQYTALICAGLSLLVAVILELRECKTNWIPNTFVVITGVALGWTISATLYRIWN